VIGTRLGRVVGIQDEGHAARPEGPSVSVWIACGLVALAGAGVYMSAYAFHHMLPVGWDVFGYVWQTSAIGHASLGAIGSRPGVPALAALLRSVAPLVPMRELVVLPIVLAVALSLAVAATVRTSLRAGYWVLPVLIAATLLWPGTARNLAGYDASLLLLVVLAAAAGPLVQSQGRATPSIVAAGLFAAAALVHPPMFAVFVGVVILYVLLSAPSALVERRAGAPVLATDAGAAIATVGVGAAAGAAFLFGALGVRPQETLDTGAIGFLFRGRTVEEIRRTRPWGAGAATAIGAAAAWVSTHPHGTRRGDRGARAIIRLGLAWLVVAGTGVLLSLFGVQVPGARFLLFALPIPALVGLGLAAVARLIAGGGSQRRPIVRVGLIGVAVIVLAAVLTGFADPGYRLIRSLYTRTPVSLTDQLGATAAYAREVPGSPPIVVVVDEPGPAGAYTPKLRLNVIRTAMPPDRITRTFVFVGHPEDLLAGRPTLFAPSSRWRRTYDRASRNAWAQVRPALEDGAVVVVLERYAAAAYERLATADPSRIAADGVYVLRGPMRAATAPGRTGPFRAADAASSALWMLVVLGAAGWGFARAALPRERASALDVACLAPAVGAGAGVLAASAVAALGGDPSGPLGVAVLVVLAGSGLWIGLRSPRNGSHDPSERSAAARGSP
jgi:hypothetical protein